MHQGDQLRCMQLETVCITSMKARMPPCGWGQALSFFSPSYLARAGERIATTASKPRHSHKERLIRHVTSVVYASPSYSRWERSDSIPYSLIPYF